MITLSKDQLHPLTQKIRLALADAGDPANAVPMQAYMKSTMPYRGVKSKPFKEITKRLYKESPLHDYSEFETVVRELWDADFREERYAAIGLCEYHKKFQTLEALSLYQFMISTGAWWDLVDVIASHLLGGLLKRYPSEMKPVLCGWINDENIWIRRSALLAQLSFKQDTDEEMLFDFCRKRMDEKEFWIRKAIGWVLREYSKTHPDSVGRFVEENRNSLSGLSLREASKYL